MVSILFLFSDDYAFMGSLIIREVVNELLTKGLDNAKVLLLAGSRSVFVCAALRASLAGFSSL